EDKRPWIGFHDVYKDSVPPATDETGCRDSPRRQAVGRDRWTQVVRPRPFAAQGESFHGITWTAVYDGLLRSGCCDRPEKGASVRAKNLTVHFHNCLDVLAGGRSRRSL